MIPPAKQIGTADSSATLGPPRDLVKGASHERRRVVALSRIGTFFLLALLFYSCATAGGVEAGSSLLGSGELFEDRVDRGSSRASLPSDDASAESGDSDGGGLPESLELLPSRGEQFWREVMTSSVALDYQAVNGISQCTRFVSDVIAEYFDSRVHRNLFPSGVRGANDTFLEWIDNESLYRLSPDEYTIEDVQALADEGSLVLMAYYYPEVAGHVAFVGHSGLDLFTYPPIPGLEGTSARDMGRQWFPVMVQAGTYTGVTSMVYATNGWLRDDNFGDGIVRYYLVRDTRR